MSLNLKIFLPFLMIFNFQIWGVTFEPYVLWDKPGLSFCFYDRSVDLSTFELRSFRYAKKEYGIEVAAPSNEQKALVKKVIAESFTTEKTGISFSYNPNCNQVDILVVKNKVMTLNNGGKKKYGRASMGENGIITYRGRGFFSKKPGFYEKGGEKSYVSLRSFDRTTVLHEFGHVAGLRHEHARDEAYDDRGCSIENSPGGGRSSLTEGLYVTTDLSDTYDSRSVMNQCYINRYREKINNYQFRALSLQDEEGLRRMYR